MRAPMKSQTNTSCELRMSSAKALASVLGCTQHAQAAPLAYSELQHTRVRAVVSALVVATDVRDCATAVLYVRAGAAVHQ
jgi:hypothetical protein